jgi:hypothetical protein
MMEKQEGVRFQGANGSELGNYGRKAVSFDPVSIFEGEYIWCSL